MRCYLLLATAGMALADYRSQNSGYETAEVMQPAPPSPVSADGGDQQAYNTDGKQFPSVRPPPPSQMCPPAPPTNYPTPRNHPTQLHLHLATLKLRRLPTQNLLTHHSPKLPTPPAYPAPSHLPTLHHLNLLTLHHLNLLTLHHLNLLTHLHLHPAILKVLSQTQLFHPLTQDKVNHPTLPHLNQLTQDRLNLPMNFQWAETTSATKLAFAHVTDCISVWHRSIFVELLR
ncbi:hypothetical protein OSTOST_08014 [Ostertagia ostertagi]